MTETVKHIMSTWRFLLSWVQLCFSDFFLPVCMWD